jgi:protein AaeX
MPGFSHRSRDIMQELNFGGVFVPAALVWAAAAFVLSSLIGRVLSRTGFYQLVWHRALFDFSIFVLLWGAISAIPYHLAFSNAWPR